MTAPVSLIIPSARPEDATHGVGLPEKLYMDSLTLHSAVFIVAYAVGLNIEVDYVTDNRTETGEDYSKISPEGTLPLMLLKSGEKLSTAGMQFLVLCDMVPGCGLHYPHGTFERVKLLELLLWLDDLQLMVDFLCDPDVSSNAVLRSFFVEKLGERLVYFDHHILARDKQFIQAHLTVADIYFYTIYKATYPLNLPGSVTENCLLIQGYMKRLHLLPKIVGAERLLAQLAKERGLGAPSPRGSLPGGAANPRSSLGAASSPRASISGAAPAGQRTSVTKRRASTTQENLVFE